MSKKESTNEVVMRFEGVWGEDVIPIDAVVINESTDEDFVDALLQYLSPMNTKDCEGFLYLAESKDNFVQHLGLKTEVTDSDSVLVLNKDGEIILEIKDEVCIWYEEENGLIKLCSETFFLAVEAEFEVGE